MNKRQFSRRGFTLIEMLVVIVCIVLLVALLLPALTMAQALSQSTGCTSNLRQLGTAYNEYLSTCQNQFVAYSDVAPNVSVWMTEVVGYIGNNPTPPTTTTTYYPSTSQLKVFQCPSTAPFMSQPFRSQPYLDYSRHANKFAVTGAKESKYPYASEPDTAWTPWLFYTGNTNNLAVKTPNVYAGSYGFNEFNDSFTFLSPWNTNASGFGNPSGEEVSYTGNSYASDGGLYGYDVTGYFSMNNNVTPGPQTPLFGDCGWYDAWPNTSGDYATTRSYTLQPTGSMMSEKGTYTTIDNHLDRFLINRHNNAINMVFRDGHADHIPLSQLWQLHWSADFIPNTSVTVTSEN
ncbi:MAG TPA: prepilin-type N-terminal cleavage/methylation domain-containing protein [Phycisphaerae bacterium]|nr:prepilin-type N-terminal cleavage/methylation domain-containing protein [Phycisphaerae bacterium]